MKNISEYKFLLKHSSIYGVGNLLSKMVAFIMLPLYTRYLNPTHYGILELLEVTSGLIAIVMGVGVAQAMSRFYYDYTSETDRKEVVSTIYIIVISVVCVFFGILFWTTDFFAELVLDNRNYSHYFLLSFMSLGLGLIVDIGLLYLRVLHKSILYIAISIAYMIIGISLNILFIVYYEFGVLGVLLGNLVTHIVVGLPFTIVVLYKVKLKLKLGLAKEILKFSLPLIPAQIANAMVNSSDRYFIKYFLTIGDAGIYGLANKIGTSIHMLVTSPFIMTFVPRRFEIVQRKDAHEIFSKVFDYYVLLILTIGLFLSVFCYEIMVIMTTPEFYPAGKYVPMIALSMVIFGMKYHFEFGILYSKKTKYYLYINVITSIVHLILNFYMIREYGLWGALIASMVAIMLNNIMLYKIGNKLFKIEYDFTRNIKLIALAAIIYFLSLYEISDVIIVTVLYKLCLLASYLLMLVALKIVTKDEVPKFLYFGKNK